MQSMLVVIDSHSWKSSPDMAEGNPMPLIALLSRYRSITVLKEESSCFKVVGRDGSSTPWDGRVSELDEPKEVELVCLGIGDNTSPSQFNSEFLRSTLIFSKETPLSQLESAKNAILGFDHIICFSLAHQSELRELGVSDSKITVIESDEPSGPAKDGSIIILDDGRKTSQIQDVVRKLPRRAQTKLRIVSSFPKSVSSSEENSQNVDISHLTLKEAEADKALWQSGSFVISPGSGIPEFEVHLLAAGAYGCSVLSLADQDIEHVVSELESGPKAQAGASLEHRHNSQVAFNILKARELRPVNFGIVTPWRSECGLATYAEALLEHFDPRTFVLLGEYGSAGDPDVFPGMTAEFCWKRGSGDFEKLWEAIQTHQLNLVHFNIHSKSFFPAKDFLPFLRRLRASGVKVSVLFHSIFTLDPELELLVREFDCLIAHTPEMRLELISNGADPDITVVLRHGVQERISITKEERLQSRQALGIPLDQKVVATFGFVQPHKGIEGLIEGLHYLASRRISAVGYVVGRPIEQDSNSRRYQDDLKKLASAHGVSERINFLDRFVTEEESRLYLKAADVVLFNYSSRYYEASGATAKALSAGSTVMTSVAPAFSEFGDAVWHVTSGYHVGLSLEILFTNEKLTNDLDRNACRYCHRNSWSATANKLTSVFENFGFKLNKKEELVNTANHQPRNGRSAYRVLMQNRPNTFSQRGGDTIVMEQTRDVLAKLGLEVVIDCEGNERVEDYDIVHLFNFALPELTERFARNAKRAGVPYVVTTLSEDVDRFHNQSHFVARKLISYVQNHQREGILQGDLLENESIVPSGSFNNQWTIQNAGCLITNGKSESAVLRRIYGENVDIREVFLGVEVRPNGNGERFIARYGVQDFILCVGRLETRKNQLALLKAFEHSPIPIVLVGGGFTYQEEYDEAARRFQRAGKTLVLGRLSDEELADAYAAARVHVLPSWYELPGLVSLEAASYGCNIVATRWGTSADYLGEDVFYCSPHDLDSIYAAGVAAYHAPVPAQLAKRVERYTWDQSGRGVAEVYASVLNVPFSKLCQGKEVERPAPAIHENFRGDITTPRVTHGGGEEISEKTLALLERGEELAREKEYTAALQAFHEVLESSPRTPRALRGAGAVYLAGQNIEKAKECFDRASVINPEDPKAQSGVGICLLRLGRAEEAYEYFVRALELDPDHQVTLLQLLECSYRVERYDDLLIHLRRFVEQDSENLDLRFSLAGALFKSGNMVEAQEHCNRILAADSSHEAAEELRQELERISSIQAPSSRQVVSTPNEAPERTAEVRTPVIPSVKIPDYVSPTEIVEPQRMTTTREDTVTGNTWSKGQNEVELGVHSRMVELEEMKRQKKFDEVEKECSSLLNLPSLNSLQRETVEIISIEVAMLQGSLSNAESRLRAVLQVNPSSVRAITTLGALRAAQGDWGGARECFEQALSIDSRSDRGHAGMGMWFAQNQDFEKAWECYETALRTNFEAYRALLGLIELGYRLNRLPALEQHLRNYLEVHPADLEFVYSLAGCLFTQGKRDEARSEVEKILLFRPEDERALELRELIEGRKSFENVPSSQV